MDCGVPFCQTGCPVNNLIPDWNDLSIAVRWKGSRSANSTPPTISPNSPDESAPRRVKPRACSVSISPRSRSSKTRRTSLNAHFWKAGFCPEPQKIAPARKSPSWAPVPQDSAAAQQLCRIGHAVTVYEKSDYIGGLLRYGIPQFKLEKHIIDRRLDQMAAEGVQFITNAEVRKKYFRRRFAPRLRRHRPRRRLRTSS